MHSSWHTAAAGEILIAFYFLVTHVNKMMEEEGRKTLARGDEEGEVEEKNEGPLFTTCERGTRHAKR